MQLDPILLNATIADRQARVCSDVKALRGRARRRRASLVRRQLGQALIALGQHIGGSTSDVRPLPAQPVLSGVGQR